MNPVLNLYPRVYDFKHEVLNGLQLSQKRVSPKFLYDERGSELFERICESPEYYPTRTELRILEEFGDEIVACLDEGSALFEFGSGSGRKTSALLRHCQAAGLGLSSYVPIDISREMLGRCAREIARELPGVRVQPVCADYTRPLYVPASFLNGARARVAFFPGSTIGNLDPADAEVFLGNAAKLIRGGGKLIVGVDRAADRNKDPATIEAAYNDRAGWTEQFNKNLLRRMNQELGANIPLDRFEHLAYYDPERSRVEMHLRSTTEQEIRIQGITIRFKRNETIHTENSYKYSDESFAELASRAGYEVVARFTDPWGYFAVFVLRARAQVEVLEAPDLTRLAA